jgi:UDP-N-acetylglucosamine 4,6-dehydratase
MDWSQQVVLITGGTGSLGRKLAAMLLAEHAPRKVIILSRDELKQHEMRTGGLAHPNLRYFIGDVRDPDRLRRAMHGVDIVVHAAALKQVPACEYNPIEAVLTNVMGARNVIDAALDCQVRQVLAVSTDKAVNPVNVYGATKLVSEKLFVQANAYSGQGPTRFSCVRYGNVVGSRGSVVPLFIEQRASGRLTVTDPRMTRFWLTLDEAARFVLRAVRYMHGGEIFVPKLPSMNIMELARAVGPGCQVDEVGARPGERMHEVLLQEEESRHTVELDDMFVIKPAHPWWPAHAWPEGRPLADGFRYTSDRNERWLSAADLRACMEVLA